MTDYYERHGEELARRYDALDPAQVHACWSHLITGSTPGLACDIGAGSGRDARWLARQGWEVVAVEPAARLRAHGERVSAGLPIHWLGDSLPALTRLRDVGYRFDLVLLSAVWQHVTPPERERAFRVVSELLRPGGQLVVSLRRGRDTAENRERGFHTVDAEQLRAFGRRRALLESMSVRQRDADRPDVDWEVVAFQLPDDGTGSLALLRHVIVFGTFLVPTHLWRTLSEFSSWLEPVIAREWSMLLGRWRIADYRSVSPEIFVWEERSRFTRIARQRLEALGADARPPACVWTGRSGRQLDIDHCFPWARWPNNDLWNLLPATAIVNREKSDRLPTIAALQRARHHVTDWWTRAYLESPLQQRFLDEASMALPALAPGGDLDAVFEAILHQRTRIKSNQQLRDWDAGAIAS